VVRPINLFQMKLFVFSSSNLPYHMYGSCSHSHIFIGSFKMLLLFTVVCELTKRSLLIGRYKMKFRLYNIFQYYLIRKGCPISSILVLPQWVGPIRSIACSVLMIRSFLIRSPIYFLVHINHVVAATRSFRSLMIGYSLPSVFCLTFLRKYMNEL